MAIKIVNDSISKNELRKIAENQFGELVKAVIDIEKAIYMPMKKNCFWKRVRSRKICGA